MPFSSLQPTAPVPPLRAVLSPLVAVLQKWARGQWLTVKLGVIVSIAKNKIKIPGVLITWRLNERGELRICNILPTAFAFAVSPEHPQLTTCDDTRHVIWKFQHTSNPPGLGRTTVVRCRDV